MSDIQEEQKRLYKRAEENDRKIGRISETPKKIKKQILMLYDLAGDKDIKYYEGIQEIIDYIAELEESNKEWEMIFDTFSQRPYAHKYLEQKRKELGNDKIIGLDSEMIYEDYYNLQNRIDKAIQFIDNKEYYVTLHYDNGEEDRKQELLDILKGDNK